MAVDGSISADGFDNTDSSDIAAPLLSLLLATYNVTDYIGECLQHISQGVAESRIKENVELIIIDDASTDASFAIVKKMLFQMGCRTKLVQHVTNLGVGRTRNELLLLAQGQYIWFVDPDDKPQTDSFAAIFRYISTYHPDVMIFDWFTQNDTRRNRHGHPKLKRRRGTVSPAGVAPNPQILAADVLLTDKLYVWNKIFKRSLSRNIAFPDQRCFEDIAFSISLLLASRRTLYVREPFITYRHRAGSLVSALSSDKIDCWRRSLQDMYCLIDAYDGREDWLRAATSYCLYTNYFDLVARLALVKDHHRLALVRDEMLRHTLMPFKSVMLRLVLAGHPIRAWRLYIKNYRFLRKYGYLF